MKTVQIVLAALLIGLLPLGAALAQQVPTPVPLVAPPGPVSRFPTRFDVVDAPEQFDQVLLIIDFPGGAWTPSHTPGGYLYVTVIDGEITSRTAGAPDTRTPTRLEAPSPRTRASTSSLATVNVTGAAAPPNGTPPSTVSVPADQG